MTIELRIRFCSSPAYLCNYHPSVATTVALVLVLAPALALALALLTSDSLLSLVLGCAWLFPVLRNVHVATTCNV